MSEDFERLYGLIMAGWASQAVRAMAALSVAEHLDAGPKSAAQVAEAASCDPSAMYRLLRAATALGLARHDATTGAFERTSLLGLLDGRAPVSLKQYAQAAIGPAFWLPALDLAEVVRSGTAHPESRLGVDVFGWMADHPIEARQFAAGMSDLSGPIIGEAVAHIDASRAGVAVDIGGAEGAFLVALLEAAPHLHGIVHERDHLLPAIADAAERHGLTGRMRGVAGDFLASVPEGDLYLLKFVLHDWDDDACREILTNIRRAMHHGAALWIVEMVAGSADVPVALATMDMAMLFAGGGEERELQQFADLLGAAGLTISATTELTPPYCLIEARPG